MFVTPLLIHLPFLWILSNLFTPAQLSSQGQMHDDKGRKNEQFLMQYNLMWDKHFPDSFAVCELLQPSHTVAISITQLIVSIHYLHSILGESDRRTLFLREENVDSFPACKLILDSNTLFPPPCRHSALYRQKTYLFFSSILIDNTIEP